MKHLANEEQLHQRPAETAAAAAAAAAAATLEATTTISADYHTKTSYGRKDNINIKRIRCHQSHHDRPSLTPSKRSSYKHLYFKKLGHSVNNWGHRYCNMFHEGLWRRVYPKALEAKSLKVFFGRAAVTPRG